MPAADGGIAHALFVSKDRRIPKIRIQTRQLGNLLDKRIIVVVDSWDCLSRTKICSLVISASSRAEFLTYCSQRLN